MQSVEPKRFDNKVKILAIWVVGIILGFAIVINIETILIFISNHLPTILIVILYIIAVNYPSLTQGALHLEGAGMFTMPQTFGNIARMPMFTLALKSALEV